MLVKETKTTTLKIRLAVSQKLEIKRFAMIHRVDMADVVRLGIQRLMDGADKPQPLQLNGR